MATKSEIFAQGDFGSGEISPSFAGMLDNPRFFTSCRIMENMLISRTNGLVQRGGFSRVKSIIGERYFYRETTIQLDGILRLCTLEVYDNAGDVYIMLVDAVTYEVLFDAAFTIDVMYARQIDIVSYDRYIVILSPGTAPYCLYSDTADPAPDILGFGTLESLYEVDAPLDGKTAPVWTYDNPLSADIMMSRLIFVSKTGYYGSEAGDPMNFKLTEYVEQGDPEATDPETVVTRGSAFTYLIDNQDDGGMRWIRGGMFAMGGSARGAWIMSNFENGLDATNPNIRNHSGYGASNLPGLYINGAFFYFDHSNVAPRIFTLDNNGPTSLAIGEISSHMFIGRTPKQMLLQTIPESIVWILMDDGELISFQYEPTTRKAAWARHHIRNAVIENIAITSGRILQAVVNRDGIRCYMQMLKPFSDEWHDTLDQFYYESQIPDRPWVASAQRIAPNGRLELTVNGPIEDDRPYRIMNSGALIEPYYLTEYAINPETQANDIKKIWLKDAHGVYVTALAEDRIGLDPRGMQIVGFSDEGGDLGISITGTWASGEGSPLLLLYNDDLNNEYYRIKTCVISGLNTLLTITGPIGEKIPYESNLELIGTVMLNVPYEFRDSNLAGQRLSVVTDRNYYEELYGDENGVFRFAKPVMGAVIGEPIESRFSPRYFTDRLGPRHGRIVHFYPFVINTPGLKYGVTKINSVTYPYDEIDFYTGPSKKLSLGVGGTPDANFYIYGAPGSRLEISHIFYELEVI